LEERRKEHTTSLLPVYKASFFLNQEREDGLKLRVVYAGDHVYTDFQVDGRFNSETDTAYDGIAFGVMDVLMWYAIMMKTKKICVTRKTDMEFFQPVRCDTPYRAVSRLVSHKGREFHVEAWIEDGDGRVCIKLTALFREGKGVKIGDILTDFDFSETTPEMKELFYSFAK